MILADTSVWIALSREQATKLPTIAGQGEIVVCMPVVLEFLQGIRDERAYRTARDAMLAFRVLDDPMPGEVFLEAVDIYRAARRQGLTIRSKMDCLIAAVAIRHGIPLLHRDRDFEAIAKFTSLDARALP